MDCVHDIHSRHKNNDRVSVLHEQHPSLENAYHDSNDDTQTTEHCFSNADDGDGDIEDAADSEKDSFTKRP